MNRDVKAIFRMSNCLNINFEIMAFFWALEISMSKYWHASFIVSFIGGWVGGSLHGPFFKHSPSVSIT